jgi:hypothetical protein
MGGSVAAASSRANSTNRNVFAANPPHAPLSRPRPVDSRAVVACVFVVDVDALALDDARPSSRPAASRAPDARVNRSASRAFGPLTRTTLTPARPRAVASAYIVSPARPRDAIAARDGGARDGDARESNRRQ